MKIVDFCANPALCALFAQMAHFKRNEHPPYTINAFIASHAQ